MYFINRMQPWKQSYDFIASPWWSNRFAQVATALHLSEKARSAEWCNKWCSLLAWKLPSPCTDTAVHISRLRTRHGNRYPTNRLLQEKTKKHFVGIQEIPSPHITVYQRNTMTEQKLLQRRNKNRTNVTKTNYSTQFRYRKPRYGPARSGYRHHRQVEQLPPAPIYGCHRWHSLAKHRKPERFQEPTK